MDAAPKNPSVTDITPIHGTVSAGVWVGGAEAEEPGGWWPWLGASLLQPCSFNAALEHAAAPGLALVGADSLDHLLMAVLSSLLFVAHAVP